MSLDYHRFSDRRVKHLEMVQAVIGRLGNDSFLVKGWAVTVAGVFAGLAVNSKNGALALASLLPTAFFWGLDTYFLRSERLFRVLYEHVRRGADGHGAFFMGATSSQFIGGLTVEAEKATASWRNTFWRPTLRWFYGALAASAIVVALIVCIR